MRIKQRIMTAARQLMAERGFKGWTMDELSARAQVSKRTLYRYYASKEALIEAVIDDFLASMGVLFEQLIASGADLKQIIGTILPQLLDKIKFVTSPRSLEDLRLLYPHLWEKINAFRTERIQVVAHHILQSNPASPISNIDPRVFTAIITASVQAVVNPDFILENGLTFEEVCTQFVRFYQAVFNLSLD